MDKRLNKHFLMDGLLEIVVALWCIMLSVVLIIDGEIFLIFLLNALLPILLGPVLQNLKRRLTDPRIGYVKMSDTADSKRQRTILIALGLFVILLAFGVGALAFVENRVSTLFFELLPVAMPFILIITFIAGAVRYEIGRFYIFAVLLFIMTLIILFIPATLRDRMTITALSTGVLLLLGGVTTLIIFLRMNPIENIEEKGMA